MSDIVRTKQMGGGVGSHINSNGNGVTHIQNRNGETATKPMGNEVFTQAVRGNQNFNRIINVLTEEISKIPKNTLLLLVGSSIQGYFREYVSDLDLLGVFAGDKHNMPYIDLGELKNFTGAVNTAIRRLDGENIHVVVVPPYTSGIFMLSSAGGKISAKKGIDFDEINPIELQVRLYPSFGEGILTEDLPDILGNMLRFGKPLLGSEFLNQSIDFVHSNSKNGEKDPQISRILAIRKMFTNGLVTHATNIHLRDSDNFKVALRIAKDVSVELLEELMKGQGRNTENWSFARVYGEREAFPNCVKDIVEMIHEQREIISGRESPTITTEELYAKTAKVFNELVMEMFDKDLLNKNRFAVERRA